MTLQEIKDNYAQMCFCEPWDEFIQGFSAAEMEHHMDEVAKRYATECCKASLEKAADNAATIFTNAEETRSKVHKPSIVHESNIVLC